MNLLIGGAAKVRGPMKNFGPAAVAVCKALEPILEAVALLRDAPFKTIHLIVRFGDVEDLNPEFERIRKDGDLPVAVELPMALMRSLNPESIEARIRQVTVDVIRVVSTRYSLPYEKFSEELLRTGAI